MLFLYKFAKDNCVALHNAPWLIIMSGETTRRVLKNYRRHLLLMNVGDVLSSFGFFSSPSVSRFGHVARYAPSPTYICELKTIPKYNKANF